MVFYFLFTDRLERNIINDAIEKDKKYNLNKAPSARKYTNMQKTIEAINNCGVSFSVWEKRNADGTPSGLYDWTSMVGNEKKKVLQSLPEKFPQILDPEHCGTITQIWKVFLFFFPQLTVVGFSLVWHSDNILNNLS